MYNYKKLAKFHNVNITPSKISITFNLFFHLVYFSVNLLINLDYYILFSFFLIFFYLLLSSDVLSTVLLKVFARLYV